MLVCDWILGGTDVKGMGAENNVDAAQLNAGCAACVSPHRLIDDSAFAAVLLALRQSRSTHCSSMRQAVRTFPVLACRRRVRRASPTRLPRSRAYRPRLRCRIHAAILDTPARRIFCECVAERKMREPMFCATMLAEWANTGNRDMAIDEITFVENASALTLARPRRVRRASPTATLRHHASSRP